MGQPVYAPQMLRKNINGTFIEALMEPRPLSLVDKIATVIPSTSDKENYGWLAEPPIMETWVDNMPMHQLGSTGTTAVTGADEIGYEVKNVTKAGALIFKREDLADDKVGGFQTRINDQVNQAFNIADVMLIEKLVAGTSDACYIQVGATAEAMFSATHAARGEQTATWSNLLSGAGTAVANFQTDIAAGLAALYNMLGENNQPINRHLRDVFILFPPALEAAMRTAVLAGVIDDTSNVSFAPSIELISEPLLTGTSAADWYIGFKDAGSLNGLIWQDREGVMLEEVGEGSEMWTNLRQVEYATTRRGAAAFGRPQRLLLVNN